MAAILTSADLAPFVDIEPAKAVAMIEDALALAARVAPCILDEDFAHAGAARAILRGAVIRWHEAGSGAFQSTQTGPFGAVVDTRQQRRGMFWPSEIEQLQSLCSTGESSGAFDINTVSTGTVHSEACSLAFGATYCSCGADIAGFPLFGV